jgi:hypothetical protein
MKEIILAAGALFLALSAVAFAALSTPPIAAVPVSAQPAPNVPFAAAACCSGGVEATMSPAAIHEAHADGGYWYYAP